jgi:homoserine dehydrogenase
MAKENMSFEDALAEAQKLGYAERNPSADIDGLDSCRKICILASLAFGHHVYPEQVHTEGITNITLDDIRAAETVNCKIKLIGNAKKTKNNYILVSVMPTLVSSNNILSNVDDVYNGITVYGDGIDRVMFYGRGAGKLPTASAVLSDIVECVKHNRNIFSLIWSTATGVTNIAPFEMKYFVRKEITTGKKLPLLN